MRKFTRLFMLCLLLLLPILACGPLGGSNNEPTATTAVEPTNTPQPTNTPEPTNTPAPTNTPEPTATPEPVGPVIPNGYQPLESAEAGVTVYYPADWVSDAFFGFITLATNEELLDSADPGEEGAVAIIISDSRDTDLGLPVSMDDGALAILSALLNDLSVLDLGDEPEILQRPVTTLAVNEGHDVATAQVQATSENGTLVAFVIKIIITDNRFALFMGATPAETLEQYAETLETIGNSILLSEPGTGSSGGPGTPAEAMLVVLGDIIEGELTETISQRDFMYNGSAGETLAIAVIPETDDQDLILAIYAAANTQTPLIEVDDGFSGEGESLTYTFTTSGDYIIRVREFGFPDAGLFYLFIGEEAIAEGLSGTLDADDLVIGNTTGTLPSGESKQSFIFTAVGGEALTFTLTPGNNNMDVVLEIFVLPNLNSPIIRVDTGFRGEAESLTYTFTNAGTYIITVSEFYGSGGPFNLVVAN